MKRRALFCDSDDGSPHHELEIVILCYLSWNSEFPYTQSAVIFGSFLLRLGCEISSLKKRLAGLYSFNCIALCRALNILRDEKLLCGLLAVYIFNQNGNMQMSNFGFNRVGFDFKFHSWTPTDSSHTPNRLFLGLQRLCTIAKSKYVLITHS